MKYTKDEIRVGAKAFAETFFPCLVYCLVFGGISVILDNVHEWANKIGMPLAFVVFFVVAFVVCKVSFEITLKILGIKHTELSYKDKEHTKRIKKYIKPTLTIIFVATLLIIILIAMKVVELIVGLYVLIALLFMWLVIISAKVAKDAIKNYRDEQKR